MGTLIFQSRLRAVFFALLGASGILVAIHAAPMLTLQERHFDPYFAAKFLRMKAVFLLHAAPGITALLLGPWLFVDRIRLMSMRTHRIMGRLYILCILCAGIGGLLMAFRAEGGLVAQTAFLLLAVLWIFTGSMAFWRAVQRRIQEHRNWMIRNYALTFSAVTLRVYLHGFQSGGVEFDTIYPVIAWACWVPNLAVAEAAVWWRRQGRNDFEAKSPPAPQLLNGDKVSAS